MLTRHLRINDSQTSKPVPVRMSVTGPNGEYYAPLGRLSHFPCGLGEDVGGQLRLGRENWCYIDGACEIPLPSGVPLRVRATKGLEFAPLDETVTLGAGQMAMRFGIQRVSNRHERGWRSLDGRGHFLTPHAAGLEAAAEDLDCVNLLAKAHLMLANDGNTYPTLPGMLAFSGQVPAHESFGGTVIVNTLNTHPVLGHLALLNSHRAVYPIAFGQPLDTDDWSLLDWCNQCHRKNGLVVWVDAFRSEQSLGGEALLAAILGKIDAIEFDSQLRTRPLVPWCYRLWNAGIRLPFMGSSGKESNRTPLGAMRTYTNHENWIEGVRTGQTFITNGPILHWDVSNGIHVRAECGSSFEKLELVADGQVVASAKPSEQQSRWVATLEAEKPNEARWWAVRCVGGYSVLNPASLNFAHTSPVFSASASRDAKAVSDLLPCIQQVREWATSVASYRDEKWRKQLLETCDTAERTLMEDVKSHPQR